MAVRSSALRTGRPPFAPRKIPGTHFCQRLRRPQSNGLAGRIRQIQNSSGLIGNRTRDILACSTVDYLLELYLLQTTWHQVVGWEEELWIRWDSEVSCCYLSEVLSQYVATAASIRYARTPEKLQFLWALSNVSPQQSDRQVKKTPASLYKSAFRILHEVKYFQTRWNIHYAKPWFFSFAWRVRHSLKHAWRVRAKVLVTWIFRNDLWGQGGSIDSKGTQGHPSAPHHLCSSCNAATSVELGSR
jgi:hypothetical protein